MKDVKAVSAHDTCTLGDGVVDAEGVVKYLLNDGWNGTICIEHEPFDHDPMPDVVESVRRLKEWMN